MTSPFSWSFTTGPAPAVTGENPAPAATGVAVSSPVTATFNEAVQSGTIGFTLKSGSGSVVAGTVAYNSSKNTATLTPSAALAYETTYTATVSGAKDTAGDPMSGSTTWTFTTDAIQPAVSSQYARHRERLAWPCPRRPVRPSTRQCSRARSHSRWPRVREPRWLEPATYNTSTNTETFTPTALLAYGSTYTATVSGAKDADGDAMSGSTTWTFTTDALQPAVTSHTPATGATGVAAASTVSATFNEAVQTGTITFTLTPSGGAAVAGTLSYVSSTNTAVFTPSTPLAMNTTYTATVSGAEDADGDPMSGSTSWSFTTDALQPAVSSHTPASGATGVTVSAAPSATFNEAVQSGTVSFTLATSAGTTVAGTASYNTATNTETFTPTASLAYGTTYTATVSGAKDVDGDPMNGSTSWSFTTDPLQPAVTSHVPVSAPPESLCLDSQRNFQRGCAIGHSLFHADEQRGKSGCGRTRIQQHDQHRNVHAERGARLLHYLHSNRQRRQRRGGDPMAGPVTWSFTTGSPQVDGRVHQGGHEDLG